jgi:hypothetical protein
LLGACEVIVRGTGYTVLAVTSRRVVWVGGWSRSKVRELPYKEILAAKTEQTSLSGRKIVIAASPQGVQFLHVTPPDRQSALAALINERAQRER